MKTKPEAKMATREQLMGPIGEIIKGKPIETKLGRIYPALRDRVQTGAAINMIPAFKMIGRKVTITHRGKKFQIDVDVSRTPDGLALVFTAPGGRHFVTDLLLKLIGHAVHHGLLDPELKFERTGGRS